MGRRGAISAAVDARPQPGFDVHDLAGGQALPAAERRRLIDGLTRAFPDLRMQEYFDANPDWFEHYDHLVLATERSGGDVVGVLAACWRRLPVDEDADGAHYVHATTQFIAPRWQGSSMLRGIWRRFLSVTTHGARGFPRTIVLKTCHPSAFRPMTLFAGVQGFGVYPSIAGTGQDAAMARLAAAIAAQICPGKRFDLETGVIRDVSTPRDFYSRLPACRRAPELEAYFHRHLTPNDRILCIARIDGELARAAVLSAFGVAAHGRGELVS